MRVDVTAEDITNGKHQMHYHCPIALALNRQTGKTFCVGNVEARACGASMTLPFNARDFIHDYDNYRFVAPFSFVADLKEELNP